MGRISALVLLKVTGAHYGANVDRTRLLIRSLDHFLEFDSTDQIGHLDLTVICPADELPRIAGTLGVWERIQIRFLSEEDVIPGIGAAGNVGWFKQQILKLAATARADTEFTLIFDPDIVLIRPLKLRNLVRGGRCFTNWESKRAHPQWWEGSAAILGFPLDLDTVSLGVTPQVLSRTIAGRLNDYIAIRCGSLLALLAEKRKWTEYSLYGTYAEHTGLIHRFHFPQTVGEAMIGRSAWVAHNLKNYSMIGAYEDTMGGYFSVCQSHLEFPPAELSTMFDDLVAHLSRQRYGVGQP